MTNSTLATKIILEAQRYLRLYGSSNDVLNQLVKTELLKVLTYAKNHSKWWSDQLLGVDLEVDTYQEILKQLPKTDRNFFQTHFEEMQINPQSISEDDRLILSTSGSTGQPVKVLKRKSHYVPNYQAQTLFEWLLHAREASAKMLFLKYAADNKDEVSFYPLNLLGENNQGLVRDPSKTSAEELLDVISAQKPKYIVGTLAPLLVAARLARLTNRDVSGIVQSIATHADPVLADDRELIKAVFGAEIFNRYSTEEVGYVAIQCRKSHHLHVLAPNIIVEILDKEGNLCAPGETGEIYFTLLNNFTMPIIRYAIGDYGVFGGSCEDTNWPVIEQIVGRVRSSLRDANGSEFIPVLGTIPALKEAPILEYQIFLFDDAVIVLYRAAEELPIESSDPIAAALQERLRTSLPVKFMRTPEVNWRSEYKKKTFAVVSQDSDHLKSGSEVLQAYKSSLEEI